MSSHSDQRGAVEKALRGAGLSDKPWEFDSSIHSWRCEYPERYGACKCFQELVDDLVNAVSVNPGPDLPPWDIEPPENVTEAPASTISCPMCAARTEAPHGASDCAKRQ